MTEQPLTVNEVLRNLHHDFLNQLQLIKMNLALENVDGANQVIDNISLKFKQSFALNGLKSEQFVEWLNTCEWRFSAINITIESDISDSIPKIWDCSLRNFMENTLQYVTNSIDPMVEQNCEIYIMSTEDKIEILFNLSGKWDAELFTAPIDEAGLIVAHEHYSDTLWRYRVIGSKEGI